MKTAEILLILVGIVFFAILIISAIAITIELRKKNVIASEDLAQRKKEDEIKEKERRRVEFEAQQKEEESKRIALEERARQNEIISNLFAKDKKTAEERLSEKKEEAVLMAKSMIKILRKANKKEQPAYISPSMEGGDTNVYFYDFVQEYGNSGLSVFGAGDSIDMPSGVSVGGGSVMIGSERIQDAMALGVSIEPQSEPPSNSDMTVALYAKKEPILKLKPKDVFDQLGRMPVPFDLENLEEKIAVLKMKIDLIKSNQYAKKEVIDMVTRLENRKKYDEFKTYFEQYDNTTTDKINDLVNKYDLVLKTLDLFIPKFPKDAMEIMTSYKDNVIKLCGKTPIFYVIAEKAMFAEEYKRNDPILLVQSPFGIYWQILGAWDKELILLEEL